MTKPFNLLFCLAFTVFAQGQIINFPDPNFKAKLLQPGTCKDDSYSDLTLDANNNGEIEANEVTNVYFMDVSNTNISDLTGINYFTNLFRLNCSNNALTNITIDNAISIGSLIADHNLLTAVNVHFGNFSNDWEPTVNLSYNQLTAFSISNVYLSGGLYLGHNQLSSLSINNCMIGSLSGGFDVSYNNLSSIQFSGSNAINGGNFTNNQFTLLDLTGAGIYYYSNVYIGNNIEDRFHNLQGNIYYTSNNTTLDLGNYSSTTSCDPDQSGHVYLVNCPNLRNIILKNGYNHATITCNEGGDIFQISALNLQINNCPNLSYICVDEGEQSRIQSRINSLGLQNQIQVNTYCSFVPGGTFYSINGRSHFDANANGCDLADPIVPNQKFNITNGTQTSTIISYDSGEYAINVGAGNHTITPIVENAVFTVSPASITASFPSQSSPVIQDFCFSAAASMHDFDITLIPTDVARPGFDAHYKLVFKNTGNITDSGTATLTYPDNVLDWISASVAPTTNTSGNLSWSFSDLLPFETRSINLTFNLNSPTETPPLNGNDNLHFTSAVAETGASDPTVHSHLLTQTVVNSFDPNDKVCLEGENLSNLFIGKYVTYKIRFENTGTAFAENIVVKDMIDITKFDIASLMPVSASHNFYTKITGNQAEFIFQNINLPFDDANNDGYVVFKIKLLPNVTENIPFQNKASIYFDYNFPIITNTATSIIMTLSAPEMANSGRFTITPIPALDVLQLHTKDGLKVNSIEIYNQLGQIVLKEIGNTTAIDVSKLFKGSYYLRIKTDDATDTKQFLKQ
jgi:uncharacterized repeat protein (TIGR01451 family)